MITLLIFAFLSGLVTIAAPCIWPLLPIVLSSSALNGDHRRPLGLTLGIMTSFGILTLSISYLVAIFKFDANLLRIFSVVILVFLGLTLLLPPLSRIVESFVSRFAGKIGPQNVQGGFVPGFITGLALGVVWTPCAGPILATIATLSATKAVGLQIVLVTAVYLIGVAIPLFIFSYAGQKFIQKSRFFNKYTGIVQRVFGAIIIATALLIFTNYDKVLSANLLNAFPSYTSFINNLEGNNQVSKELNKIKGSEDNSQSNNSSLFNENYPAPELTGITNWINTPDDKPLTLKDLKGKVVLVDFWTYTCINCIRTLPHVTAWYDKYNKDGFVTIGIHTPEFEFEKSTNNVEAAIKQFNIHYPVAQDNNYATWTAFQNQYWPAEYLIDKNGNVRRTHFGEGEYEEMEEAIRILLKEKGASLSAGLVEMPDDTPAQRISPETYIGSSRMEYYYPNGRVNNGSYTNLKLQPQIPVNSFDFGGSWIVSDEYSQTGNNASLEYKFYANKVFLVLKPANSNAGKVRVFLDGKVVSILNKGRDVNSDGYIPITEDRLYELINLQGKYGEHLLRLEFSNGIQVFAFTFG